MRFKNRPVLYFSAGIIAGAAIFAGIASRKIDPATTNVEVNRDGRPQYKWFAPEMPASLDFAGEKVPLEKWEVYERLDRELLSNFYLHGAQLYILKLSGRYMPLIEERLKANGVPVDFKYVCVAESSLQQNALSGVGAASFWQFMKDTGPAFGLEVNEEVDERFNVIKATDAASKYFLQAKEKFGSWTAAAASYNCGQNGYSKQADFQGSNNYYDMIFPDETNRYVFRILALKYLLSNPHKAGNILDANEEYKPLKSRSLEIDQTIPDLAVWAKQNNTSYKMLKIYNPWLRAHKLTVKTGKRYTILLPLQ